MEKGLTDPRHYAAIAQVLRANSADAEGQVKPADMAQKLQKMGDFRYGEGYNVGYDKGMDAGYSEGYGVAQSLIDRSITSFSDDTVEAIGGGVFYLCTLLESVVLPNVSQIGASALAGCESLEHICMEKLTTAGAGAFGNCVALTAVSLPKLTQTSQNLFRGCTALESVELPAVKKIADSCFYGCTALTTFPDQSLHNVTDVAQNAFNGCSALREIVMPQCTFINGQAFMNCSGLQVVQIANVKRMDMVASGNIGTLAFANCSSLIALVIRTPVMPLPLKNINALNGTPIAAGTGKIYVPSTLVDSYKQATNWSYYANRIFAIPSGM